MCVAQRNKLLAPVREAIVRGEVIQDPGVPESFRVLVKELQSLGLSVEVLSDTSESITFGKEVEEVKIPELGFGLSLTPTMG